MAKERAKNTYEEARKQRLEENKKKFEGLGISKISKNLAKVTTPVKKAHRHVKSKSKTNDLAEPRRSSRVRTPITSYSEEVGIDLPTSRKRSRSNSSGCYSYIARPLDEIKHASDKQRSRAWEAAEELLANLQTENPTFIKSMVRSHVYSCFWLGLPSKFCEEHLPKTHLNIILEDENGSEYEAVFIGSRGGVSGGWRGFALDHKLDDGDALVFELIEPARFKIYTTKAFPDSVEKDEKVHSEEKGNIRATRTLKGGNNGERKSKTKKPKQDTVHETNVSESSQEHMPQGSNDNDVKAQEVSPTKITVSQKKMQKKSKMLAARESKVEAQVKSVKPKGKNMVRPRGAKPGKKQKATKNHVHDAGELTDVEPVAEAIKHNSHIESVKPNNIVNTRRSDRNKNPEATDNLVQDAGESKVEAQVKSAKPKGKNLVRPRGVKPSRKQKATQNPVQDAGVLMDVEPVAEATKDIVNTQRSDRNKKPEAADNLVQDAGELQKVKPVEEAGKCVSEKPRKKAAGKLFRKRA